jgi:S-DNA-T family DNA segregation ATPase FtsK/SpoIIIE
MPKQKAAPRTLDASISRGIAAILLVILSLIIVLSFFDQAGPLGYMLNDTVLAFLFGRMRYISPVVLLVVAALLVKDLEYEYRATHITGAVLFFLTTAGFLHMSFIPEEMWDKALNGFGGGVFGLIAWPLQTYLGSIASWVILIGLFVISLLLLFNTAILHIISMHKELFGSLQNAGSSLFTSSKKQGEETEEEEAEEKDEYDGDDTDEDRQFVKRSVTNPTPESEEDETEETDETIEEEEEAEEVLPIPQGQTSTVPVGPWSYKPIIRELPPLSLLQNKRSKPTSGDIKGNAQMIQDTLSEFGIDVDMGEIRVGPTVTQYSCKPHKGIKLSRIIGLSNDLALALAAHPIRIEAPIPGKSLVGIEVPNEKTAMVTVRELLENEEFIKRPHDMMVALGKDVAGKIWFADLPRMPHLLIAGATGSGKTVCMNTIILSLLYQNTAETLRIIMVDPKRVELTFYNGIPHLLTPVITNTHKTVNALKWTIGEMERRFEVLSQAGNRDIQSYNASHPDTKLPYLVFIIDELADLMAQAANDVEGSIIRIAQMARAVGIHLIVATQRPSVDVITGLMKANIPGRIAFSVASAIDSRTILDSPGAENLLGRGDMLLSTAALGRPVRIQGAYISEEELKNVVEYLKGDEPPTYDESIVGKQQGQNGSTPSMFGGPNDGQDPLFEEAKQEIVRAGKASASFLQRKLKVGYARAARLLDELESAGVIGPGDGAKPRDILVTETEVDDTMDAGGDLNVFSRPTEPSDEDNASEENDSEESNRL